MGRKYAIQDQDQYYFVTFTLIHWLDVFIREEYRSIFVDSLKFCQKEKGLQVGAWCLMTSHAHLILGSNGQMKLEDIIRDFKSFTSRHIRKAIEENNKESRRDWLLRAMVKAGTKKSNNKDFQFWLQHNHPIELNSNEMIDSRVEYIHQNPVVAGFVDEPREWKYSSARDYEGERGLVKVAFLD